MAGGATQHGGAAASTVAEAPAVARIEEAAGVCERCGLDPAETAWPSLGAGRFVRVHHV